jgi:hypothetical protein
MINLKYKKTHFWLIMCLEVNKLNIKRPMVLVQFQMNHANKNFDNNKGKERGLCICLVWQVFLLKHKMNIIQATMGHVKCVMLVI